MKNLKFSFAIIIAVLAVGFTVASKASSFNKKLVSGCWSGLTIQDVGNTQDATPVYNSTSCDDVKELVDIDQLQYVKSIASPVDRTAEGCTETPADFCCLVIEEISNPNDFPNVPEVDFGDGLKKYRILEVLCRP